MTPAPVVARVASVKHRVRFQQLSDDCVLRMGVGCRTHFVFEIDIQIWMRQ